MMKNMLNQPYMQRIEIAAWDVAISGMTHSHMVQQTIRQGARFVRNVDWQKDPKIVGLAASGGLLFGSSLAILALLFR